MNRQSGDAGESGVGNNKAVWAEGGSFYPLDEVDPMFAQIARQIIDAIERGDFRIGSKLPGEVELARRFNVSRASVREALCSLQFAGYLESRRGSGTIVTSTYSRGTESLLGPGLKESTNVLDVLEARLAVEPMILRRIAMSPSAKTINQINKLVEGMALTLDHPELNVRTDLGIHLALAKACPNPFLGKITEQLVFQSEGHLWRKVRDKTWQEGKVPKQWLDHHIEIANAISSEHPDDAESAMKEHLLSVVSNFAFSERAKVEDQLRAKLLFEHYS